MPFPYSAPPVSHLRSLAAFLILALAASASALAQSPLVELPPAPEAARGVSADPISRGGALYDQISFQTTGAFLSQVDAGDARFSTEAADDLTVPAGVEWTVDRVIVRGFYLHAAREGDCQMAQVRFRNAASGVPGTARTRHDVAPLEDHGGVLVLSIPPTQLPPGQHWVSVVCTGNLRATADTLTNRRWNWLLGRGAAGASAVIRNDGGGWNLPSAGWNAIADFNVAPPSYSFAVFGTASGPLGVASEAGAYEGVAVGSTRTAPLTLTNTGSLTVTVSALSLSGLVFSAEGWEGATLAPGASTTVPVSFTPTQAGQTQATVAVLDPDGRALATATLSGTGSAVSTEGEGTQAAAFSLSQNYPNPFSGRTRVAFETPAPGPVHLAVYDALGRQVAVLVDTALPADRHTAEWDANGLASGVYLIRLQAGEQRATLRALVVD